MKICIAQTNSIKGDISANIDKHLKFIEAGAVLSISAIFFPELSIIGYEPELAGELATTQDDKRFDVFQKISDLHQLTIGIGVPTLSDGGVLISMVIFQPFETRQTYSKQQIHSDEFPYFISGKMQTIINVDQIKIAPAICYESLQPAHAAHACKLGAEIYMASVAKTHNGINKAMLHYPEVATKYSMPVLMANCIGYFDNSQCVGKSSVWNCEGKLVGQLKNESEGLLIFNTETEEVKELYMFN